MQIHLYLGGKKPFLHACYMIPGCFYLLPIHTLQKVGLNLNALRSLRATDHSQSERLIYQFRNLLTWVSIPLLCWWHSTHAPLSSLRRSCFCRDLITMFGRHLVMGGSSSVEAKSQPDWAAVYPLRCILMPRSCDLPGQHTVHTIWRFTQLQGKPWTTASLSVLTLLVWICNGFSLTMSEGSSHVWNISWKIVALVRLQLIPKVLALLFNLVKFS